MYSIVFEDESKFNGGEFYDSKWNEMPSKLIKEWKYMFCDYMIVFSGYEEYNHIVEKIGFFGHTKNTKVLLMARKNLQVDAFVIDLETKQLYKKDCMIGKEYNNKSTTASKKGILGIPHYEIRKRVLNAS